MKEALVKIQAKEFRARPDQQLARAEFAGTKDPWKGHSPDDNTEYNPRFNLESIVNPPRVPVVSIPKMDVVGENATYYESRTYANEGVLIISKQRPPESAVNQVLRPNVDIIEVGEYKNGNYDLLDRISDSDEEIIHNGKKVRTGSKPAYIASVIRNKNVGLMATHEQDPRLVQLARDWHIDYPEDYDMFRSLSTKSGLHKSLEQFHQNHPDSPLVPFGKDFEEPTEAVKEVMRLRSFGVGAYIKLDFAPKGQINAGGEGQLALPTTLEPEEVEEKLSEFLTPYVQTDTKISGIVQMFVPDHKVFSISSGQRPDGDYDMYDAHLQTQNGNTAEGAKPLKNNKYSDALLNQMWPALQEYYKENQITGRENVNFLVLPPDYHEVAKKIYDNPDLPNMFFIDFNYRAISGTLNAITRFQEETGEDLDLHNYRSKGVKVHPFYAANPHLIYAHGRTLGLQAGEGGNFSVINLGTFNPKQFTTAESFKTQVVVSGTENPDKQIAQLEERLQKPLSDEQKKAMRRHGFDYVEPDQAASLDPDAYTTLIAQNLQRLVNVKKN